MKNVLLAIAFVFVCAASGFSQNAKPAPTPTPPDDNDPVKISTNLIQVDVSVTDKSGKAVPDLKPEEIEIYENGQKQKITHFSFVSSVKTVVEKPNPTPADKNAVPIPQTVLRPEQIRRTIALV